MTVPILTPLACTRKKKDQNLLYIQNYVYKIHAPYESKGMEKKKKKFTNDSGEEKRKKKFIQVIITES